VQQLEVEVEALTARAAPRITEVARLRAAAAKLAPMAGTQAVTGPALSVTLDDAKRTAASLPEGFTADDIVVHQQDVQNARAADGDARSAAQAEGSPFDAQVNSRLRCCTCRILLLYSQQERPSPFLVRASDLRKHRSG
jgi:ferredoxin